MPVLCAVGCTCEPIEERSRVGAISVVSHSVREYECALFVDEEVASQLKHVRRESKKTLSLARSLRYRQLSDGDSIAPVRPVRPIPHRA